MDTTVCGAHYYKGKKLNSIDTLIVDASELPVLQDSLQFFLHDSCFQTQLGAAHRKGNRRRTRPANRKKDDIILIEYWSYESVCCISDERPAVPLELTILVIDTIAPTIQIYPDPSHTRLFAAAIDADEAWISWDSVQITTIDSTYTQLEYWFEAQDYAGNVSTKKVIYNIDNTKSHHPIFLDMDTDGLGNPDLYLEGVDSLDGFVTNNEDCNDEFMHTTSDLPDILIDNTTFPIDFYCDSSYSNYDQYKDARPLMVDSSLQATAAWLIDAQPTVYPVLDFSCIPNTHGDLWFEFIMPDISALSISIMQDWFAFIDVRGFSRIFMAELYVDHADGPQFLDCFEFDEETPSAQFINNDLSGQTIKIRVVESGNKNDTPFFISLQPDQSTTVSIEAFSSESIVIYPNPIGKNDFLHFNTEQTHEAVQLRLIDAHGRIVMDQSNYYLADPLELTNIETGLYYLWLESNQNTYQYKLVVL